MKARFFALAALVLGLASCQQEFDGAATVGGEVDFQLNVAAPDFGTRANDGDNQYGYDSAFGAIDYLSDTEDADRVDWTEVNLRYTLEVYDAGALKAAPVKDRQVKIVDKYESVAFDLRLVPNRNYQFVVFADFVPQEFTDETITDDVQGNAGLHHVIGSTLQDIKIKNDAINNECTDAYFVSQDIVIKNSAAQDLVLRRPFGKVRVIATDLHELNLNVEPKSVKVTYESLHANAFNAVEGTIDGKYTTNVYTNVYNDIKKTDMDRHIYTGFNNDEYRVENANGEVRNTHMTLFTDYILANVDQETIHFTMEVIDANGQTIKETIFNTDIPVQRNYLTTIVGNVLTTATEINVTIDDNFGGEYVKNMVLVNTAKELQEALDAYENGQTILFDANIEGNVTVDQVEGKDYVIDGNGYEYTGTITIDGNARMNEAETVLIKNVNFVYAGNEEISIIEMNSTDGAVRYAHNVTIEKCTFNGNGNTTAIKFRQCKNIVIKDCEVISGHSLAQLYGCTNVTIEGTTVKALRGVSFGTSTGCVVKNSTFDVEKYGLRVDADGARTLTIEDSSVKAFLPVVARKASTNYTINFEGNNTLEAPGYDVVFTTGDDEATFVAPAEYTVDGADNFKVFPRDNYNFVYTTDDLKAAVAAGGDHLLMPTTIEGTFAVNKPVILKGVEGATIKGRLNIDSPATGATFKNIKFAINDDSKVKQVWTGAPYQYPAIVNIRQAATTFEGCEFETNINAGVCGINYGNADADKLLTVNKCKFEGDFYPIRTRVVFNITNCEFISTYEGNGLCAVWTWGLGGNAGTANFSNNKGVSNYVFNGVQATASNYAYSNTTFTIENNNGFTSEFVTNSARNYTNSTLNGAAIAVTADALKNAANAGQDVYLLSGEYTMPAVSGKEFAISGTRDAVITVNKPNLSGSDVTFNGVTVKGSGYATGVQHVNTVTYNNVKVIGEMCLYGEKVSFNECEFELNNQYIWTYGAKAAEFNKCVFNTSGKAILVYNEGAGANNVTVNNCTFNATAGAKAGAIANQNCAAIEIDNFQSSGVGAAHKVTASNNTYNSNFSGEWRIKNYVAGNAITVNGAEYTQIAVDGKLMTIDADKNVTIIE